MLELQHPMGNRERNLSPFKFECSCMVGTPYRKMKILILKDKKE